MTRVRIFPPDRTSGLGASELGAIGGLSPWRTPLDVWLAKVEETHDREPTEAQAWGLALEGTLVHHVGGRRNSMTWSHPDWPVVRLFATPDGFMDNWHTIIEAKSVSSRFSDWAEGIVPDYYRAQAYGQLACYPSADRVLFSVLIAGRHETRTVERDADAIEYLVEDAMRWWANHVARGTVPPPVTDEDRWTIARRNAADERMSRLATADEEAAASDLLALREQLGAIEAELDSTRLRLAELAQGADIEGAGWRATWSKRITRDYRAAWIDDKGTAALPDAHVMEGRVFTVRSIKEKEL